MVFERVLTANLFADIGSKRLAFLGIKFAHWIVDNMNQVTVATLVVSLP